MLYLLLFTGCGSIYSIDMTAGTWEESNYQFSNNDCQLENTVTEALNLSYTFQGSDRGEVSSYDFPNDEQFVDSLEQQSTNLWSLCQENDSPTFTCDFPTFLIHFDQWKENFSPYTESLNNECTLELNGYTEGLFIDSNTAFVSGSFNINCTAYNDLDDDIYCDAQFSSSWTKR